jgi:prenyltransferase beta subunit
MTLTALLVCSDYCHSQEPKSRIESAIAPEDGEKIVALPEETNSVEVAPGDFVAFLGTQINWGKWKTDIEKTPFLFVSGDCICRAVILPVQYPWEMSEKDPGTWPMWGVYALKEGTATAILELKDKEAKRVITVTVKKPPENWKENLLAKLKETKVSVQFKDTSLAEVAKTLSEKTGLKIVADYFDPDTKKGSINHSAENEPLAKILDTCTELSGGRWLLINNRIFLTTRKKREPLPVSQEVDKTLSWLHNHQSPDGSFSSAKFMDNCACEPKCSGAGNPDRDITITGFALLAFLGHGHTHRVGRHKLTVRSAIEYLLKRQNEDGSFSEMKGEFGMFDHFAATAALCEAYAVTRDPKLKEPSEKAIAFLLKSQQGDGGWSWEPKGGKSNSIATAFAVLALKAASTGRIEIPKEKFSSAVKFFDSVTNSEGEAGYEAKNDKQQPLTDKDFNDLPICTAASVIASIFCGESRKNERVQKGVAILLNNLPEWDKPQGRSIDPVYWYFATYSLFIYGGEEWKKWCIKTIEVLEKNQEKDGCATGSWAPSGRWSKFGGRLFFTAIAALTAEIQCRYFRVHPEAIPEKKEK